MNTEQAWRTWWDAEGKHMERLPHHDAVDHMASVTRIAWLNCAFEAADEIERLRADVMCLKYQNAEFVRNLTMAQDERNAAVAERDEANANAKLYRDERDEARRVACAAYAVRGRDLATERGWDCWKDDK